MLYEVITRGNPGQEDQNGQGIQEGEAKPEPVDPVRNGSHPVHAPGDKVEGVITSYSIHYTKLYDKKENLQPNHPRYEGEKAQKRGGEGPDAEKENQTNLRQELQQYFKPYNNRLYSFLSYNFV